MTNFYDDLDDDELIISEVDQPVVFVEPNNPPDIVLTALGVPGPQGNLGPQGNPGNQGPAGTGFTNGQPRYSYPYDPPLDAVYGANPGDQWLNTVSGNIFTLE